MQIEKSTLRENMQEMAEMKRGVDMIARALGGKK